jgi:hypothetical protein
LSIPHELYSDGSIGLFRFHRICRFDGFARHPEPGGRTDCFGRNLHLPRLHGKVESSGLPGFGVLVLLVSLIGLIVFVRERQRL